MAPENTSQFAALLRRARTAASLTQEELAERASVSVRAISNLERGVNRAPHKHTLDLIADALDLPVDTRAEWRAACRRSEQRDGNAPVVASGAGRHGDRPRNIPVAATSLLGREADIAYVTSRMRCPSVRMVTLTGPGGVGKTRLALAVAEQLVEDYPDGAHFVGLASVRDPDLVTWAIATALNIQETGNQPLHETVAAYLGNRRILLMLDNFEHLLEAAPLVSMLLAACPMLNVLTTSRAPLRLQSEREIAVSPLALPATPDLPTEALVQSPAVELFVERAKQGKADFALTKNSATAVAAICTRLDGLPLAIELAAARIKMLTPQALLARLDRPLALLTNGTRDAPSRQQTIRQTIEWSYNLLGLDEQRLLRQCAVFVGGWTLEAAEAVCDPCLDVLTGLSTLVDHSLVKQHELEDGSVRFRMLETIREFTFERLAEEGDLRRIQDGHASYFTHLAEEARPALSKGSAQRLWLKRLDYELNNLREAFDWSVSNNEAATAFRLSVALELFWEARGDQQEARRWLETVIALPGEVPPTAQADAFRALGFVLGNLGEYQQAAQCHEQAINFYQDTNNLAGLADAYREAGGLAMFRGDYVRATELHEHALAIARTANDPQRIAHAMGGLSIMAAIDADYQRAQDLATESLHVVSQIGDQFGRRAVFGYLGYYALWQDDLSTADHWTQECIRTSRELGDMGWLAFGLELLGYIELERDEYRRAQVHFREALHSFWQWREMMPIAECLEGLAGAASGLGDKDHAARLLGAAASLRERVGAPLPPPRVDRYERTVTATRAGLGDAAFNTRMVEGRAWTLDQAVSYALDCEADEMLRQ